MKEIIMNRALDLSKRGVGKVNPNPMVGAIIVKNKRIISEGYHEFFGGPHAEVNAVKNAEEDIKGSEIYVTLEPCSHYGKTPPCTDLIIKSGIKKVYVGMLDPNPLVAGKGIEKLRNNGIEVEVGILEKKIKKNNEVFIKYITEKIPFCILKTAMTLDGKIATHTGDSQWISNEESRKIVHQIRNKTMAIMVGRGTVEKDNPKLNTRLTDEITKDPVRIVVDTNASIPLDSYIIKTARETKTIIAVSNRVNVEKLEPLIEAGVEILKLPLTNRKIDLKALMKKLGARGIDSVLIEGGGELGWSAIESEIVDKIITFIAPKIIGGTNSKTPIEGVGYATIKETQKLKFENVEMIQGDILIEAKIIKEG